MLLQIGEFSKKSGISIRTLRYYDEIDLFKPIEIDLFTGYRYYSDEQINDLELINKLKSIGFSLSEIKKYWNNFTDEIMLQKQQELKKQLKNLNSNIKELDYLRSHIINGKIVDKLPSELYKVKSLYREEKR